MLATSKRFYSTFAVLLSLSSVLWGQSGSDKLSLPGLKMDGVETDIAFRLRAIAEGHTNRVLMYDLGGRTLDYQILLDGYLTSFGLACSGYLPKDKVEWTIPKCDESVQKDDGDFECVREGKLHTQVFVDRNLWDLKHSLLLQMTGPQEITPEGTRVTLQGLIDAARSALRPEVQRYYQHLWIAPAQLVLANGCLSPQLRRFQDNLIRDGMGLPMFMPVVKLTVPSATPLAISPPLPSGRLVFAKLNYLQLILDLKHVRDNNGRQAFDDVPDESIKNISLVRSDSSGAPNLIEADCRREWDQGTPPPCLGIQLWMSSTGYPYCISSKPNSGCVREPTDEIVAKYQSGGYSIN